MGFNEQFTNKAMGEQKDNEDSEATVVDLNLLLQQQIDNGIQRGN